jgi:hypothetical protein
VDDYFGVLIEDYRLFSVIRGCFCDGFFFYFKGFSFKEVVTMKNT